MRLEEELKQRKPFSNEREKLVVNSIYTGFNGPATGEAFENFKIEFDKEIKKLLAK